MNEPPELTHLRDTLPRQDAVEAFRHFRERDPDDDAELEQFIEEYVREAYSDGVGNWEDLDAPVPTITRQVMKGPIGQRLEHAGFASLWEYLNTNKFVDLDQFRKDVELPTLAPAGFNSFICEFAAEDGNWQNAFRALATNALNTMRRDFPPSIVTLMDIHRIAHDLPKAVRWADSACKEIAEALKESKQLLERQFQWDDEWLGSVINKHVHQADI